jgi:ion channel
MNDRRQRGGRYRYAGVLLLTITVAVFALLAPDGPGSRGIELLAAGVTLLVAVLTSRAPLKTRRAVAAGFGPAILAAVAFALLGQPHAPLTLSVTAVLLACTVGVILSGLVRLVLERGVVLQAVFGALAVYVLVGLTFAFTIGAIATGVSTDYFTQGDATQSIRVYYSFTVLTTTGFGDYTAATRGGHSLAVLEMLIGQLYLVTVIATLVGNLRHERR